MCTSYLFEVANDVATKGQREITYFLSLKGKTPNSTSAGSRLIVLGSEMLL